MSACDGRPKRQRCVGKDLANPCGIRNYCLSVASGIPPLRCCDLLYELCCPYWNYLNRLARQVDMPVPRLGTASLQLPYITNSSATPSRRGACAYCEQPDLHGDSWLGCWAGTLARPMFSSRPEQSARVRLKGRTESIDVHHSRQYQDARAVHFTPERTPRRLGLQATIASAVVRSSADPPWNERIGSLGEAQHPASSIHLATHPAGM
jgi:hypothetical protein